MTDRLAFSNIAWSDNGSERMLRRLAEVGLTGVEVAPTKVWPDWDGANEKAARSYRRRLANLGLVIPSLQAIVYGKPELNLFDRPEGQRRFLEHLGMVSDLAAALGASSMVLGAPANRDKGQLQDEDALELAVEFFRAAGGLAAERHVVLCLEPNPPQYGCNFVTTSSEGARLVEAVDSDGFRLHLDAAGMHLSGEDGADAILSCAHVLQHFHASEPHLGAFTSPTIDHDANARALASIGYSGWISVEMRETADPKADVVTAFHRAAEAYAPALKQARRAQRDEQT